MVDGAISQSNAGSTVLSGEEAVAGAASHATSDPAGSDRSISAVSPPSRAASESAADPFEGNSETAQGADPNLRDALSAVVPHLDRTIHSTLSHINRHLDERVTALVNEMSHQAASQMHENTAHMDGQLDARIRCLGSELAKHVDEMASQAARQIHANAAHMDERLNVRLNQLEQEIAKQIAEMSRQVATQIHDNLAHVDRHLNRLIMDARVNLAGRDGKASPTTLFIDTPKAEHLVRQIGRCLRVEAVKSHDLVRIGGQADGGYVLLDNLGTIQTAFSFGVGDEVSFDLDLAQRGITVHQFDHTINAAPVDHEKIHFHRVQIAPISGDGADSLSSALRFSEGEAPVIVKMDIEGDEWSVLEQFTDADADRIAQFVCEFHNFDQIAQSENADRALKVLSRLREKFGVVHLHANNYGKVLVVGTVTFPEILEVSFANRTLYEFVPADVELPTALDRPNRGDIAEIALGGFRY